MKRQGDGTKMDPFRVHEPAEACDLAVDLDRPIYATSETGDGEQPEPDLSATPGSRWSGWRPGYTAKVYPSRLYYEVSEPSGGEL